MLEEHADKYRRKLAAWLYLSLDSAFNGDEAGWRTRCGECIGVEFSGEDWAFAESVHRRLRILEPPLPQTDRAVSFATDPQSLEPFSFQNREEWHNVSELPSRDEVFEFLQARVGEGRGDAQRCLKQLWKLDDLEPIWRWMPAVGETPWYTIWQRNQAASALAGCGDHPCLLSFRVGGVQNFIDQARKTEDYWASSYLISYLMEGAVQVLVERFGPECLIFPATQNAQRVKIDAFGARFPAGGVPNGLLALVGAADENAAGELGDELTAAFAERWGAVVRNVMSALSKALGSELTGTEYWTKLWARQTAVASAFELFWTVTPWDGECGYAELYSRASREMEARKLLRDFVASREENLLCHLCGQREALQSHVGFDRGKSQAFWRQMAKTRGLRGIGYRFRAAERLCAVCTVCRLAGRVEFTKGASFPSTSTIAVSPFVERLYRRREDAKYVELIKDFVTALQALWGAMNTDETLPVSPYPWMGTVEATGPWSILGVLDGDWWHATTYDPAYLAKEWAEVDKGQVKAPAATALQKLKALLKACKKECGAPCSYLGLLVADGDEVGEWISGRKQQSANLRYHPAIRGKSGVTTAMPVGLLGHLTLGEALGSLERPLRKAVEETMGGVVVYCGGDDLFGLVPLHEIGAGMEALASATRTPFHVSATVLIVPHNDPLTGAIRELRQLQKEWAKGKFGRASGAIAVRRTSGQQTVCGGAWRRKDSRAFLSLGAMIRGMAEDVVSPRLVGHLERLAHGLEACEDVDSLEKMAVRMLIRAAKSTEDGEKLSGELRTLVRWEASPGGDRAKLWPRLLDTMVTVRFLSRMVLPEVKEAR